MRECEVPDAVRFGDLREELVADVTGGHFNRKLFLTGEPAHIRLANVDRDAESFCRVRNQPLVGITAFAAQAVVQVGRLKPPSVPRRQLRQKVQQHHGIHSA